MPLLKSVRKLAGDALSGLGAAVGGKEKGWKHADGVYTWNGYEWGVKPPPEHLAQQYFSYKMIEAAMEGRRAGRGLEIGCGWGARTPWIGELCDEMHGVEPNAEVLADARAWYPGITFQETKADAMPYPDDHFDLIVSWTVLQHIPPEGIEATAREVKRVLAPGGALLLFETMKDKRSHPPVWYRKKAEYEEMFSPLELRRSIPRSEFSGRDDRMELMVFA